MSIHNSSCPLPHSAMYFWDMMCDNVSVAGTICGEARKESRSAVVICVGV